MNIASRSKIEVVRSFWDARPCNIRHSPRPLGSREYFDEVETRKYFVESHIPSFADFARWNGKRVLEIGCGIGTDAVNFARAGANYTGVELSTESLALTRKRFEVFGLHGSLLEADAETLSERLAGESFDLIYSFGVIHHSPHPERIIAQARKLLKPDGEFRLMLYSKYSWKSGMIAVGLDRPEAQFGCPIADTFSYTDIENLLAGFRVTDIHKDHIFKYKIAPYRQYRYEVVPWLAWIPTPLFRRLEKVLGWHTLVTCKPV